MHFYHRSGAMLASSSSEEEDAMSDVEPEDPPAPPFPSPTKTDVVIPAPIVEERSVLGDDLMLSDSASEYDVSMHGDDEEEEGVVIVDPPLPPPVTSLPQVTPSWPAAATSSAPRSSTREPWVCQPTRPAPISTMIRRLRATVQVPTPVPRPAPETYDHYRRRTKEITANRIVCRAANYSKTTRQCVDDLTTKYSLRTDEQLHCLKSVRIARLSQKRLATLIRRQFRFVGSPATKDAFINWLDDTLVDIKTRSSDSDDN